MYLTGHPLNVYEEEVKQLRSRSLKSMAEDNGNAKYQKKPVMLVGLVSAVRTQNTDRGKRAFVTLDDKTAYYEVFVFSNVFEEYEHLIKKEEVLVIEGTLNTDYTSGAVRLRIEKLHDIEGARNEFLRRLTLNVNKKQTANGLLDKLDEILPNKLTNDATNSEYKNTGQCPVFVNYETENEIAELRLGPDVSAP
mgnify:CR=1 FL=1